MKLQSIIILMVPVIGMCLFIGKRLHVWDILIDILFQNRATKFLVGGWTCPQTPIHCTEVFTDEVSPRRATSLSWLFHWLEACLTQS